MIPKTLVLLAALAWQASLSAQIVWDASEITVKPDAAAETVDAVFTFHNKGTKPVAIIAALPECGCTSVEFDETPVAPGKSAQIKARFSTDQRSGRQISDIRIYTDSPDNQEVKLRMIVEIPDVLYIESAMVRFDPDHSKQTKTTRITFPSDDKAKVVGAESEDPAFQVEAFPDHLVITRVGDPLAPVSKIEIATSSSIPRLRKLRIYAVYEKVD